MDGGRRASLAGVILLAGDGRNPARATVLADGTATTIKEFGESGQASVQVMDWDEACLSKYFSCSGGINTGDLDTEESVAAGDSTFLGRMSGFMRREYRVKWVRVKDERAVITEVAALRAQTVLQTDLLTASANTIRDHERTIADLKFQAAAATGALLAVIALAMLSAVTGCVRGRGRGRRGAEAGGGGGKAHVHRGSVETVKATEDSDEETDADRAERRPTEVCRYRRYNSAQFVYGSVALVSRPLCSLLSSCRRIHRWLGLVRSRHAPLRITPDFNATPNVNAASHSTSTIHMCVSLRQHERHACQMADVDPSALVARIEPEANEVPAAYADAVSVASESEDSGFEPPVFDDSESDAEESDVENDRPPNTGNNAALTNFKLTNFKEHAAAASAATFNVNTSAQPQYCVVQLDHVLKLSQFELPGLQVQLFVVHDLCNCDYDEGC
ncbi:hypothetical protein JKP88DRAFT_317643 [Tribonema minus]|uniref:Uncharacterized protein n=1 Tax=Tribonema minus TaxID=303371 RepID=A0A835YWY5_9STRA|nr:hypothetical protein JKP88DRAFT_317643 [Tribonema minus]